MCKTRPLYILKADIPLARGQDLNHWSIDLIMLSVVIRFPMFVYVLCVFTICLLDIFFFGTFTFKSGKLVFVKRLKTVVINAYNCG